MWQKLKRIDVLELEAARTQLINASQLVSAAPRSFMNSSRKSHNDWLLWDEKTYSMTSIEFGIKEKVKVNLDLEQFVLSIFGQGDHIEHLVISGITYPMAFGWMKIKLDSFQVSGEQYYDNSSYTIANPLGPDDEMYVTSQQVFHELTLYFSNAYVALKKVQKALKIHGTISINPANLKMFLHSDKRNPTYSIGFSPGDQDYPEPYFFIQLEKKDIELKDGETENIGIWNNKDWTGLVYGSGEFLTTDPDLELGRVMDFFVINLKRLLA